MSDIAELESRLREAVAILSGVMSSVKWSRQPKGSVRRHMADTTQCDAYNFLARLQFEETQQQARAGAT